MSRKHKLSHTAAIALAVLALAAAALAGHGPALAADT